MSNAPETLLQRLADVAVRLTRADSAGICTLESRGGEESFRWHGVAGSLAGVADFETPRDRRPCGVVLQTDAAQ
jgi:hypothetical protein